jgi:hypothetical protein
MQFVPASHTNRKSNPRAVLILWGLVVILCAPGAIFWGMDNWDTAISYIPHTRTADIYFKGDWIQGEYKECAGVRKNPPSDNELLGLDCPARPEVGGSTHNVSIKFYGRTNRPGVSLEDEFRNRRFQWRCRRESDSFTCYALN